MADDRRIRRVADTVRRAVSDILEFKLSDPRKGMITITYVRISPDLKIASIYYTVLGDQAQRQRTQMVLERSKGYIRNELKPMITTRWLPELRFFYDEGQRHAEEIGQILHKLKDDGNS